MKRTFPLCAAATLAAVFSALDPAAAQGLIESETMSENVTVTRVEAEDLPGYVAQNVNALLQACIGNADAADTVGYYAWQSTQTRAAGQGPNYIVDFRQTILDDDDDPYSLTKPCAGGPICVQEGCFLIAFAHTTDGGGWRRAFSLRATDVAFVPIKDSATGRQTEEIHIVSDPDDCIAAFGARTETGCHRRFFWRNGGLMPLAPSAADIPAIARK